MRNTLMSLLLVVAVAGCGGKSQPAPEGGGGNQRLAEGAEVEEKHPELTPEMDAFHEVLAPLWHAEGPDREANTCAAEPQFTEAAQKLENAAAPDGLDANDWQANVISLVESVGALMEGCGEPGFEERFTAVHDGFHALMDLLETRGSAV